MTTYRQSIIKKNLELRARIIQSVRQFFVVNDYLEIKTNIRNRTLNENKEIDVDKFAELMEKYSTKLKMIDSAIEKFENGNSFQKELVD